jgi:DNA-directed RNA polymerase specialized sigma24 family protein
MFAREYTALAHWCRAHVRHLEVDPDEVLHEVYLNCRGKWSERKQTAQRPLAFMIRALRWHLIDLARAAARRLRRMQQLHLRGPRYSRDEQVWMPLWRECLESLSRTQRRICELLLSGNSLDVVARETGLSRAAVQVHLCRMRQRLRAYWQA